MNKPLSHSGGVVDAFRALSPEARKDALRALVISTMNGDECHEMLNLLSQRLHRDIFGDLPLELAALVASYLEPSETIQFRRVSKKWHALLSTPVICSTSFRYFISHSILDTNAPEWRADYQRYAKRRLNLITGRPVSKAFHPCTTQVSHENRCHYSSGMLAWCEDIATVRLLCLQSGVVQSFVSRHRQAIVCVRVSDSMIGVLTSQGCCQVWDYKSGEEGILRLPSANYRRAFDVYISNNFVIDKYTVAICLVRRDILIWNFQTKVSQQIKADSPPFFMFLHAERKQITVIQVEYAEKGENQNNRENYSNIHDRLVSGFIGVVYSTDRRHPGTQHSFALSLPDPKVPHILRDDTLSDLQATDGRVFKFPRNDEISTKSDTTSVAFLSYNKILNRPVIRYYPGVPHLFAEELFLGTTMSDDVVYLPTSYTFNFPKVIEPRGQCRPAEIWAIEAALDEGKYTDPVECCYYWFGDDVFYGVVAYNEIHVWCFDEKQRMAEEVREYRSVRSNEADIRRAGRGYITNAILGTP